MNKQKIYFRKELFWDIDINTLDVEKHKLSIVERITQRGKIEEFKEILRYYGKKEVAAILLRVRCLDVKTLSFCSVFFNIPKEEFRCYKLAQLNPEHWNY